MKPVELRLVETDASRTTSSLHFFFSEPFFFFFFFFLKCLGGYESVFSLPMRDCRVIVQRHSAKSHTQYVVYGIDAARSFTGWMIQMSKTLLSYIMYVISVGYTKASRVSTSWLPGFPPGQTVGAFQGPRSPRKPGDAAGLSRRGRLVLDVILQSRRNTDL
jgi:hypothetical protein